MTTWSPAMKPPSEPKLLEKVPMMRSVSLVRPKWLAVPEPFSPMTPRPWASSTITEALYFLARRTRSGSGAMSPSIE